MSYDISLIDQESGNVLEIDELHHLHGGTYEAHSIILQAGGLAVSTLVPATTKMCLNETFNYSPHFKKALGEDGINQLNGMPAAETINMLEAGMEILGDDAVDNYWSATDGNAKLALGRMKSLAEMRPDGIWRIDC